MESKICIRCAALLPEDAIFCPKCGKKQVHEKEKLSKELMGPVAFISSLGGVGDHGLQ